VAARSRAASTFTRLERPFVQEEWGPGGSDLEHQPRAELSGLRALALGRELRAAPGRLTTADGFASNRGTAQWERIGT